MGKYDFRKVALEVRFLLPAPILQFFAGLAHLEERRSCKAKAIGSTPITGPDEKHSDSYRRCDS